MNFLSGILNRTSKNGANNQTMNNNSEQGIAVYDTITGFAEKNNIDLDGNKKNIAGRIASDLSREQNVEIKNNYYPNAGKVNSYRMDILEQTFKNISNSNRQNSFTPVPKIKLGIDHKKLVETLDVNLEDKGLKKGTHHTGSLLGLESSLRIIYTDYLTEVNKLDIEHRDIIIGQIHQFEEDMIKCDNQLRYISEVLIPDKENDIEEVTIQLGDLDIKGMDTFVNMSNAGNSEMIPILMLQKVNYKKTLNELKARRISSENEKQQTSSRIEALNNQLQVFSYFSKDLLKNRLETFYNGWLKSYPLYEIQKEQKEECSELFEKLRDEILSK